MYKIAIIGIGSLGKRHLEAVLKSKLLLEIYIIDSDESAINSVATINQKNIIAGKDTDILPDEIDVAIISTSSGVRRNIFEKLIEKSRVKNIIFEKVLFQREEDYYFVEEQLKRNYINAWVNCARREQDAYINLKNEVDKNDSFIFQISGGAWGLGCNGIHMIDLIYYLCGNDEEIYIDRIDLLPIIANSKRKGYKEIYGTIVGHCGKCKSFTITCFPKSTLPMQIEIVADTYCATITEQQQKIIFMSDESQWERKSKKFVIKYQSQLTHEVIEKIIETGRCNLPTYDISMKLHLLYIKKLIPFFEEHGVEKGLCPIT